MVIRENLDLNIEEIYGRICEVLCYEKPIDNEIISKALSVKSNTVSAWRKRNTIPWDSLYVFAKKNKISFTWLIDGSGSMN
ncbi:MAG: hypothetical protein GY714_09230 [Desulfobacterales bacterium]|nr:hypothetical protein [Desulfobacterales bacterium]